MSNSFEFKCPNCGGSIVFDSVSQNMKCPYCDTEFDPETVSSIDDTLENAKPSDGISAEDYCTDGENLRLYICESCGGEIITDSTTSATSCPFCGNAVVLQGNLSGEFKPDIVVPFKTTKEDALNSLKAFYQKKKLLPRSFIDENKIEEIKGIYVPFWLYSSDASADLSFKGTKTRMWSDFKYNYVETSYYKIDRSGTLSFDDVPVDGSTKMVNKVMESIEPFNWNEAIDFKMSYLSGFFADKYDVNSDECVDRAKERMTTSVEKNISSTVIGYSGLVKEYSNVSYANVKVKYGLLPVWMLTTKWKEQGYTFAMNGQTGKFAGTLPIDKVKALIYFLITSCSVGLLLYIIAYLFL